MGALAGVLLLLAAALQGEAPGPSARWAFDGDVRDSGPRALPARAAGRLGFIASPVGSAGQAAVFNGVDASVEIDPPDRLGAGAGAWSVSVWVFSFELRAAPILARPGWSLALDEAGGVRFRAGTGALGSPPGACPAGQWNHVLLAVSPEGGRSRGTLRVNGEPVASGDLASEDLDPPGAPLWVGRGASDPRLFWGLLDDLRFYPRAVSPEESDQILEAGLPWMRPRPASRGPWTGGKFEILPQDVLAFVGGEDLRVGGELGYLETLIGLSRSGVPCRVRPMAWEGDTVYEQPRPLHFGSWSDQFRRAGATVLFVQFGQSEALEGRAGLDRFVAAYEALLATFLRTTRRIVLVSPSPFGQSSPGAPDLRARNGDVRLYAEAVRGLARRQGFLFVDLATGPLAGEGLTRDGLHLSTAGQWKAAQEIARQLEIAGLSDLDAPGPDGAFPRESYEKIRGAIRAKNDRWTRLWRPTNWAFLAGDRIEQPSSRDHQDRRIRWFPVEVQELPALVRRGEEEIEGLLRPPEKK